MKHLLLVFLLFTTVVSNAQVGIGTATPAASAQLEVSSTSKGFLPPRMDSTQRNAIVSPAAGLIIYNTTISALQIYSGSTWYTASAATTMGAIGGSSTTNGGTITSGVLSLAPADATNSGIVTTSAQTFAGNKIFNGNVGIGTATPPAKLSVLAVPSEPSIPGTSSAGVFRIGVNSNDGMDIGKSINPPYSSWIQNGFNATSAEPLSLNPLGGNVGIGTMTPAATAQLDVSSTTKGFLPPRMDSTQRNAIVSPAAGLTIYNTTLNAVQVYNGTVWSSTAHYIGESYGGGIVFYVYDNGQHGLIAATSDQSTGIRWNGGSFINTRARGDGIGAGLKNTAIIIANQGPVDGAAFAATVCNEYSVTVGGVTYGDWYLPSKYELNLLYLKKNVVGGFAIDIFYWSSTEKDDLFGWIQRFSDGIQVNAAKGNGYYVRAVRAF
jgi:hypothetical protein